MKLSKIRAAHTTRRLAGATIPRNGTASIGRGITLHRAPGGRCEVDGKPAMDRLDRPGRKRGKWEGGKISEDSKQTASKLRQEARDADDSAPGRMLGTAALPILAGAVLHGVSRGRLGRGAGKTLGTAGAALGTLGGGLALKDAYDKRSEADRIEKGLAKPGEEDRKFGGRAKRKAKAKDNDGDE